MHTCSLVCLLLLAVAATAAPKAHELTPHYAFGQYLADFKKSYPSPVEHAKREKLFAQSLEDVLAHNSRPSSYKKGINRFSDWTEDELAAIRGGRVEPKYEPKYASVFKSSGKPVAAEVDFRKSYPPILTAVKDQGQCGDCWAHAVTEAVESAYAIATGQLFVLSQQQVTSCTPTAGSCHGCEGSFPTLAYDYLVDNAITEEWIYPFEAYGNSDFNCSAFSDATPVNTIVNISGYMLVGPNDQSATVQALNELGPLSILADASSWSSYESGIFDGCSYADNITLDHAIMVIGYGTENGTDYWTVRNSWAPSWGELGYIRLAKPKEAHCGWNTGAAHASYDCYGDGPAAVWSCGMCGILFGPAFPNVVVPTNAPPWSASAGYS